MMPSAGVEWRYADEAELVEIKTVDEYVDRSHRVYPPARSHRATPETMCSAPDPIPQ
jgi:hypothetical protein